MTCFRPLKAWRSKECGPNGKRGIVFTPSQGFADLPVTIPCGQCRGCRLERSRQWAIRCSHESTLHKQNSFITLTYNDQYLPKHSSLQIRHFQLFMKRLRKRFSGTTIRFYHCGEYGDKTGRPHYHACLFGFDFPDKRLHKKGRKPEWDLYTSEILTEVWGMGHCVIGAVTFQSAAYVARYIMKKITGDAAAEHYEVIDEETGEIIQRQPEYTTMSRRPGIGSGWLDRFTSDVYPADMVVVNGKKMRAPLYYDRQYELTNPRNFRQIKGKRKRQAKKHAANNTPERLRTREKVQELKVKQLKRPLE